MPRFLLTIAYDGRPYGGWQVQPNAHSVQADVEAAIESIYGKHVRIHGSGRTDTGVHADGQCAHFDIAPPTRMSGDNWQRAINTKLPPGVRILACREVADDFHSRFSAISKQYRYTLWLGKVLPPREAGWAWHFPQALDLDAIECAMPSFIGAHDFRYLCSRRGHEPDPLPDDYFVRKILDCHLEADGQALHLHFHGSGFLYRMVRFMVAAMTEIGIARLSQEQLQNMLRGEDPWKHPRCAPPDGLRLMQVNYPD